MDSTTILHHTFFYFFCCVKVTHVFDLNLQLYIPCICLILWEEDRIKNAVTVFLLASVGTLKFTTQTSPSLRSAWASKLFDSFVSLSSPLCPRHPCVVSFSLISLLFMPLFFSHFLPLSSNLFSSHLPALPLPLPASFSHSSPNPSSPP